MNHDPYSNTDISSKWKPYWSSCIQNSLKLSRSINPPNNLSVLSNIKHIQCLIRGKSSTNKQTRTDSAINRPHYLHCPGVRHSSHPSQFGFGFLLFRILALLVFLLLPFLLFPLLLFSLLLLLLFALSDFALLDFDFAPRHRIGRSFYILVQHSAWRVKLLATDGQAIDLGLSHEKFMHFDKVRVAVHEKQRSYPRAIRFYLDIGISQELLIST